MNFFIKNNIKDNALLVNEIPPNKFDFDKLVSCNDILMSLQNRICE